MSCDVARRRKRPERSVTVSRHMALLSYLAAPPQARSLRKLAGELQGEGAKVSVRTLASWSSEDGWQEEARKFDEIRHEETGELLRKESVDLGVRQARLGRALQAVAMKGLDAVLQQELAPTDVRALAVAARAGVEVERLAVGEATSRSEVVITTYNRVILDVLALFEQLVAPIEADQRTTITRRFANGVNEIRDRLLPEGGEPTVIVQEGV